MKTKRLRIFIMFMIGILFLSACGKKEQGGDMKTPEEAVEYTMKSLKTLDLKAFNESTDNYVQTYRNWIGIPTETEYRVFNELLQPGSKKSKRYKSNYKLAEKIVEHMTWEIKDVRENDGKAEIDMEITNIDMMDAMGNYEIYILENMLKSEGTGMRQLLKDISDLTGDMDGLFSVIDSLDEEDICTMNVTVSAYQENGQWKIHVSDEFINAFMGNINSEQYSEEVEQRIEELVNQYEKEMEEWGEEFGNKLEKLFD